MTFDSDALEKGMMEHFSKKNVDKLKPIMKTCFEEAGKTF